MTVREVYNTMTEEQKEIFHAAILSAKMSKKNPVGIEWPKENDIAHAQMVIENMTEDQRTITYAAVGMALSEIS